MDLTVGQVFYLATPKYYIILNLNLSVNRKICNSYHAQRYCL